MRVGFDGGIKLEFHAHIVCCKKNVTSNGGLLAYRDLDYALGLFDSVSAVFTDKRTGSKRYVTFQMAEVVIDKRLFAKILSRTERLRCYYV